MEARHIDSYHYNDDLEKDIFYRKHTFTTIEKAKTFVLINKLRDFVIKTQGQKGLKHFYDCKEGNIFYIDDIGYISLANYNRDEMFVFGYGSTVDEAFIPAVMDYEFNVCEHYEWAHREELNKEYSKRFLNGKCSNNDYHGPFFYAELALKDFRKYYGNNIPENIIDYYERYLKDVGEGTCKYDYDSNKFIIIDEKTKVYSKKI